MTARREQATYTFGHHASVVNSHARRTAQDSAAFLLPHIQPHHHILDVGCGPGTITTDLAALVPQGRVTGVDAVESVLATARAHYNNINNNNNNNNNCVFEVVDANNLPYPDGSFDIVFCHQLLQHVHDPVGILREMMRVAKAGGGIVAAREADYKSFAWFPQPEGLDAWLEGYRRTARACGGEPDAGRHVRQWAKQAGMKSEHLTNSWSSWYYTGEAASKFGESWTGRALHSDFAREFVARGIGSREDLERMSATWRQWATNGEREGEEEEHFIVIPNGEILYKVPGGPSS